MPESQKQQTPTPAPAKPGDTQCVREVHEAVLRERQRIARELHDEFGATLTALRLEVAALRGVKLAHDGELARRAALLSNLLDQCVRAKLSLLHELWPTPTDDVELEQNLRTLCADMAGLPGAPHIHYEAQCPRPWPGLHTEVGKAVYRVLQEALTNVVRHASAAQVWVRIATEAGWLQVQVRDDGCGFHPKRVSAGRRGLQGMRARVDELKGHWHLASAPGQGTQLAVSLPLAEAVKPGV